MSEIFQFLWYSFYVLILLLTGVVSFFLGDDE